MPTYVYKFINTGETVEVQQSFTAATLTEHVHPETGESMPVKKVFLPVGVTFKGDGFYKTDSRSSAKKSAKSEAGDTGSKKDGTAKSDSSDSTSKQSDSTSKQSDSKSKQSDSTSKQSDSKSSAGSGKSSSSD